MDTLLLVVLIIAAIALGSWVIAIYNRMIRYIEAIINNKHQIDVQLDRRYKVFESLINTVKKYMDYEQTTLKDVVKLRTQAVEAAEKGNESKRIEAENEISKIASNINLLFENYPDLKASQNALQLQEEIVNTENKLAYAKQAYNDSIERYNAAKKSFFESMVVGLFKNKLDKEFVYWNLPEETARERESYKVEF